MAKGTHPFPKVKRPIPLETRLPSLEARHFSLEADHFSPKPPLFARNTPADPVLPMKIITLGWRMESREDSSIRPETNKRSFTYFPNAASKPSPSCRAPSGFTTSLFYNPATIRSGAACWKLEAQRAVIPQPRATPWEYGVSQNHPA